VLSFAVRGGCVEDGQSRGAPAAVVSLPPPACAMPLCVLGDRGRRDWRCALVIGRAIPQQKSAARYAISAAIRPRAAEPRARLALVGAEARGGGLEAVSLL
jgi:hypothetical protein